MHDPQLHGESCQLKCKRNAHTVRTWPPENAGSIATYVHVDSTAFPKVRTPCLRPAQQCSACGGHTPYAVEFCQSTAHIVEGTAMVGGPLPRNQIQMEVDCSRVFP